MTKKNTTPTPKLKTTRSSVLDSRGPITNKDIEGHLTFEEGLQRILEKFKFPEETRRKIFSQLSKYASKQQAANPKKGNQNDHD